MGPAGGLPDRLLYRGGQGVGLGMGGGGLGKGGGG